MGCCSFSNTELIAQLTESPFFCLEDLDTKNKSYLSALSKRFTKRRYSANEYLWEKGDTDTTFNIIIHGEVRLQFKEDSHKQMVIISKTDGQCFGFDGVNNELHNNKILYDCIAVTDTLVFELSFEEINRFWHGNKLCHSTFQSSPILPISNYLQTLNVFESISYHNASLLSRMFRWRKIPKNAILFHEGTLGEEFYIVAKGCVAVVVTIAKSENFSVKAMDTNNKTQHSVQFDIGGHQISMVDPEMLKSPGAITEDGINGTQNNSQTHSELNTENGNETRIVYEFKNGDYFGEVSLVIQIPRTATIKAIEDTTLLELRKIDFQKIPDNNKVKIELEREAHSRIAQSFRRYKIPLFNAVPLDMFHVLSRLSQIKYYKKDQIICDPNSNERALYVIAHGNVGVYVTKQRINNTESNKTETENTNPNSKPKSDRLLENDIINVGHHTRMSQKLNINVTSPKTPTQTSNHKRISQHLLPSNLYLLANMAHRDQLNRELIRLSFIHSQATTPQTSQNVTFSDPTPQPKDMNSDHSSSSGDSPSPVPLLHGTPQVTKSNKSDYDSLKVKAKNAVHMYPITPPPNMLNYSLNTKEETKEETTALIQCESVSVDMASMNGNNNASDIGSLNINLSAKNSFETPKSNQKLHTRFQTEGQYTPVMNNTDSEIVSNKKRRKSENNALKVRVGKVRLNSPMSTGKVSKTRFMKTQSYGHGLSAQTMKRNIYERNDNFVRIADLMIRDENIEKLRYMSRRGSKASNHSLWDGHGPNNRGKRSESAFSVPDYRSDGFIINNAYETNPYTGVIKENTVKIDPSDPSAFDKLTYAKTMHCRFNTNASNVLSPNLTEMSRGLSVQSQLTDMIRRQEREFEIKLVNKNAKNDKSESLIKNAEMPEIAQILPNNHSSDTQIDIGESKTEEKYESTLEERNGMRLRDFQSKDGTITFTEIEVSVLRTGNFFGETSLMNDQSDSDTETEENKSEFETAKTGATTYNNEGDAQMPKAATNLSAGKPSLYDILNNKSESKKARVSSKISRAKTITLMSTKLKNRSAKKQKQSGTKAHNSKELAYKGSHTTFRCISACVIYSITKQSLDEFFRTVPSARPWFDIMLSKYNVSLDTVLHIPRAARYFTLFLESEYAEENIHYVLSVNEFKEAFAVGSAEQRMEMAHIICTHFISDAGQQQINVSYHQRKLILDSIDRNECAKHMFDITQKAIYTLLERDCFPRFKQSHFFHEFLNEAENLALLTKEQFEKEKRDEMDIVQKQTLKYENTNTMHSKAATDDRIKRAQTVI